MGPAAGVHGGEIVAEGTAGRHHGQPEQPHRPVPLRRARDRRAAERAADLPKQACCGSIGATRQQPEERHRARSRSALFTCITGVSGGGKSTFTIETLYKAAARRLQQRLATRPRPYERIEGLEQFDKVIDIDQSPIGRTPRSNPATYTGAFQPIRDWFAGLPEAKARGYGPGRFSFNVKGGRCEACQGDGADQDRDALPARRLRHLRRLQGQALQPRDPGDPVQGQDRSPTCST